MLPAVDARAESARQAERGCGPKGLGGRRPIGAISRRTIGHRTYFRAGGSRSSLAFFERLLLFLVRRISACVPRGTRAAAAGSHWPSVAWRRLAARGGSAERALAQQWSRPVAATVACSTWNSPELGSGCTACDLGALHWEFAVPRGTTWLARATDWPVLPEEEGVPRGTTWLARATDWPVLPEEEGVPCGTARVAFRRGAASP
jgi:hypothetical protein